MDDNKSKIKLWIKQQTRIGRCKALPLIIFGLISSFIAVGLSWCIAEILGVVLMGSMNSFVHVKIFFLGFILFSLLQGLVVFYERVMTSKIGQITKRRMRSDLLSSIIKTGPSILHHQSSGILATLIVDQVESLEGYFSRWLPASVLWLASPILILVFIGIVHPWSALIVGLCGLMVPIAQALFGIGAAIAARQQFLAMTRLQARFLDRVKGIATIVLAGRAEREAQQLAQSADELRQRTMKILKVAFLSSASIDCAMVVAIVLVAITEGRIFFHPHSLTQVFAVHALFTLLLIPEFFMPLRSLALAYQDRARLSGTAASIVEIPEPSSSPAVHHSTINCDQVTIQFDHVSFVWDFARGKAIEDVSFKVSHGQMLILTGESGAGKSTIIELLLGFIHPVEGKIKINTADLSTIGAETLSKIISWIGQKPVIFSGTIRENILFANPSASEEALQAALQASAVNQYLPNLPNGLETRIGEGGFGLSGGQAQRIAIARAYLKNSPLLLLDEPTAHLDPVTERDIFNSLKQLAVNRTVILATHASAAAGFKGIKLTLQKGRLIPSEGAISNV